MPSLFNQYLGKGGLAGYLITGTLAFAADFFLYFFLVFLTDLDASVAKALSFLAGTTVAFFTNKYWTFIQPVKSFSEVVRFVTISFTAFAVNVLINTLALAWWDHYFFAYLLATFFSVSVNFTGQKWWVFLEP